MNGWKHAASDAPQVIARLGELRDRLPFTLREIIVCGMGGSALAAYVLKTLYAPQFAAAGEQPAAGAAGAAGEGRGVKLHVVDTTAPAYVARVRDEMDGAGTLLIVASKSGSTLEPNALLRLFAERLAALLGSAEAAARHCVALTDPGTTLEALAREEGWLEVVSTPADVGGRYSALTAFGLAPLVLAGVDPTPLITRAQAAESDALAPADEYCDKHNGTLALAGQHCDEQMPVGRDAPGAPLPGAPATSARLADFLSASEESGRDVVLLVLPPELVAVGRWLEQLIAESLGKEGRGLVPVVTTPQRAEELLLFSSRARAVVSVVVIGDETADPTGLLTRVRETAEAFKAPTFTYPFHEATYCGALFVDWEFAVAACGERLGINPFDQPDVAASKEATTRILAKAGSGSGSDAGRIDTPGAPLLDPGTTPDPCAAADDPGTHYIALLAWLPYSKANDALLQRQACELERRYGLPVAIEYGPRYLHSTGQAYKGGPATGLFLFVGDTGAIDLPIPTYDFTLAQLFTAQYKGDLQTLAAHSRPLWRS